MVRGTTHPLPENRRAPRTVVVGPARFHAGDLTIPGNLVNAGSGGVFLSTMLVIEVGEEGTLVLGDGTQAAVRVVWVRASHDAEGPGMGLAFLE